MRETKSNAPEQPLLPDSGSSGDSDRRRFVVDLEVGERVEAPFLLTRCDLRTGRNGPYLVLELADRSGRIEGRMWDGAEPAIKRVDAGDYVWVEASVDTWRSEPQLKVESLRPADSSTLDLADFLPAAERGADEMYAELEAIVTGIDNPHLRELLEAVLERPEIAEGLRRAPGGVKLHHAYLGGLLEHTLSVVGLARRLADHYDDLDGDLLVAGAVLHDLGKIWELRYDTAFDYTEDGRLVGHLLMEVKWLDKLIDERPDFPAGLRRHLLHLLAGHHGRHEHGAPVLPATPEALALHYLDDLDSKLAAMESARDEAEELDADVAWSPSLGRRVVRRRWDEDEE